MYLLKIFTITGLSLFFCLNAIAQGTPARQVRVNLNGIITDQDGAKPLPGASVYLPDLRRGVVANEQGVFVLNTLIAGKYIVEISYAGYASIVETVDITSDDLNSFSLKRSFLETEAVTVTGVSSATPVKRTPVPVNIILKEDFLKGSSTNLIDALSRTPGVSQISTGPAISKPVIRGLGYNRVVVVNDGIRQEGQQWGDEHGIEIDELNVNKAEVLKGPASLMYGSDALAGVINFISIVPTPAETIRGNFLTNYQTNNGQRAFHADVSGNNNGYVWGANGTYKGAGDYKNKLDGYVPNSRFNEKNFGAYVGLHKAWGFSHLYISSFDQRLGLIEGDRDSATGKFLYLTAVNGQVEEPLYTGQGRTTIQPSVPGQRVRHFKVATDNSFNLGNGRLTATLGYQQNRRQEFGEVLAPTRADLDFDLQTVNYNLQYHFKKRHNWSTSLGLNGMRQTNANNGKEVLIPEYRLFDIGGFLYSQYRLNKLTVSGGLRFDNRHIIADAFSEGSEIKFKAFSKNFLNVSVSAGLAYEAGNITLKLNLARGFRAPSIPELASNGAHEGSNRYEYGSLNLKSEKSLQADAGFEFTTQHISFSASIFLNGIKDFIYYRKIDADSGGDSLIDKDGQTLFAFTFSQANAALYGAEANLDIHPHPLDWLHFENSFSYVRGKLGQVQDGSSNLPFIPAARLINDLRGDFLSNGKTLKNAYLKLELDNTFAQNNAFTGFNTETTTLGYSQLNMGLGGTLASKGKPVVSIYLAANNLTDVTYQNHLSRLKYTDQNNVTGRQGVYNMGRNFSLKVNVPINFNVN